MENKELTLLEKSQLIDNYKSDLRKLEFQIITIKSAIERLEKEVISAAVSTTESAEIQPVKQKKVEVVAEVAAPAAKEPKKRGPKPKVATEMPAAPVAEEVSTPKKRGPKPKVQQEPTAAKATEKLTSEKQSKKAKAAEAPKASKQSKKEKAPKSSAKKSAKAAPKEKLVAAKATEATDKKKPGRQAGMTFWDTFILNTLTTIDRPMTVADLQDFMRQERDTKNIQEGDTRLSHLLNRSLNKLYNTMKIISREAYSGRGYLYKVKK